MKSRQKFTILASTMAIVLLALSGVNALAGKELHRYKIKSAIVKYTLSGNQEGTEELYFDRWGMREAKYTHSEMKMMGMSIKQNQLTLMLEGYTYNIDLDKKTGTKIETPLMKELTAEMEKGDKDMTDIGEEMMIKLGGEKIGTEEYLGRTCDVWRIKSANTITKVWNGVALYTEVDMMGVKIISAATSIEIDVEIPEEKLAIPAGVTISEGQDPMEALKKLRLNK